jgi:hypothetical protein
LKCAAFRNIVPILVAKEQPMVTKADLVDWVRSAVAAEGGRATLVQVAQHIWANHENDLRNSGDLFFTWQYDMRWAANILRHRGILKPTASVDRGFWQLA